MSLLEFLFERNMLDWEAISRGVLAFLSGQNPYLVGHDSSRFFNPIWSALLLAPLAELPANMQPITLAVLPLVVAVMLSRHFRFRGLRLLLFLLTPTLWFCIAYGNIDWLVWLGLLLPTPIGLLLLAIKPQTTVLVILVILLRMKPQHRLLAVLPLTFAVAWWVFGYGVYAPHNNSGNIAWWPYSLILGVPLAVLSLWRKSLKLAMVAGVFCTPYVSVTGLWGLSLATPVFGGLWFFILYYIKTA